MVTTTMLLATLEREENRESQSKTRGSIKGSHQPPVRWHRYQPPGPSRIYIASRPFRPQADIKKGEHASIIPRHVPQDHN